MAFSVIGWNSSLELIRLPDFLSNQRKIALHLLMYGLPLLAALIALGLAISYYWEFLTSGCFSRIQLTAFKNLIQERVQAGGSWGPVLFILIQALQVVLAPIPGEVTGVLGGFLFGSWRGFVYSTIGLTLGSALAFFVGRILGNVFVKRIMPTIILNKFDFIMARQGEFIAFLLFLIPGAPKDYLCFILGVSKISWLLFLVIVTLGRMPATLALSFQGAQIYQESYLHFLILFGACLIIVIVLIFFREKIYQWLRAGQSLNLS
jgi:uncharacterized membrane protein YdjX (TVP38/TMEM64 family)